MRCKNCDYRLWNLKSRICPECGTLFRPSEHEFLINSVQFRCPHCNQAYYGTGEKGHLTPVEFDCASCGRHIHMDEMVLLPTAGLEEEQTQVDAMPWLERGKKGAIRAWFSTVRMALVHPQRLMQVVPPSATMGQALRFGTVTTTLVSLVGGFVILLAVSIPNIHFGETGRELLWKIPLVIGVSVGMGMLGVAVLILIWGLTVHGLLRLTGKTAHGLTRTYGALCYSSAANIFTAIPCLGFYFGWIWWLISAVLMVKEGQKVHGVRASFAVVSLPMITLAALVGLSAWGMSSVTSAALGKTARADIQPVLTGLLTYLHENEDWPGQAFELVLEKHIAPLDLLAMDSDTQESEVPVSATTLDQVMELNPAEQSALAQELEDALPEDVSAHRLGDFVFTYHGIDPNNVDPGLWLVIMSFDPAVAAGGQGVAASVEVGAPGATVGLSTGQQSAFVIGLADGTPKTVLPNMLLSELHAQNALRAKYGLPPLPDPSTVLHGQPARSKATTQPAAPNADAKDAESFEAGH